MKMLFTPLNITARAVCRAATVALALFVYAASVSPPANAATTGGSIDLSGEGVRKVGRAVTVKVSFTNTATQPGFTPERVDRLLIAVPAIRVRRDAPSVATCRAALPNDGLAANCPKRSRVGGGTFTGIFGTPGQSADSPSGLGITDGKITLYNYKRSGSEQARLAVVVTSSRPLQGVSINFTAAISRAGVLTIDVPDLPQMPPLIQATFPVGQKFVLTSFAITLKGPRQRRGAPFVSMRTNDGLQVSFESVGG